MANYRRVARRKAEKYGINPRYFSRQINQESHFTPHISSSAGAQGIAQIMPGTAAAWHVNPNHPREALDAAAKHMAGYLHQFHGSWSKALTAYNAGPAAVGGPLPKETQNYIRTILRGGPDRNQAPAGGASRGGGSRKVTETTQSLQLGTHNQLDAAAFKRAQAGYVLGRTLGHSSALKSGLFDTGQNPLFASGLLSTTAPARQDFTRQVLTSKVKTNRRQVTVPGGNAGSGDTGNSVNRMLKVAEAWDRAKVHYAWGGGHGGSPAKPGTPVDCSGYVSAILGVTPRVSGQFAASFGRPGRGKTVTVWANSGHVLIQIGHRWFATSHSNPGGGAGEISRPAPGYLSAFTPRHPHGL
jgi:hypothetical protein